MEQNPGTLLNHSMCMHLVVAMYVSVCLHFYLSLHPFSISLIFVQHTAAHTCPTKRLSSQGATFPPLFFCRVWQTSVSNVSRPGIFFRLGIFVSNDLLCPVIKAREKYLQQRSRRKTTWLLSRSPFHPPLSCLCLHLPPLLSPLLPLHPFPQTPRLPGTTSCLMICHSFSSGALRAGPKVWYICREINFHPPSSLLLLLLLLLLFLVKNESETFVINLHILLLFLVFPSHLQRRQQYICILYYGVTSEWSQLGRWR